MNKKLILSLLATVLSVTVLTAGIHTSKSIYNETTESVTTTATKTEKTAAVKYDSSAGSGNEAYVTEETTAEKAEAKKISAAEAQAIALKKAGFSASEVYDKETELDYEKGKWVYEVSFDKDRTEYDYVIDAVNGEVLYAEVKEEDKKAATEKTTEKATEPSTTKAQAEAKKISAAEAQAIALKKAGFSASEVYDKETELDYEKGKWVYEVSFDKDRTEYDYVIDAVSGEVLHAEVKEEDKKAATEKTTEKTTEKATEPSTTKAQAEDKKISAAEAQAIALKKAGFSASEVYDKETELDYEKGKWVYEVSFDKDRTEYDYVIDAVNGEVLYAEAKEEDKKAATEKTTKKTTEPSTTKAQAEAKKISAAEAQAIALKKAGFSASEVYDKETELDYEKGKWVYEVSFNKDRTEYDYVIDAVSGKVLHADSDYD